MKIKLKRTKKKKILSPFHFLGKNIILILLGMMALLAIYPIFFLLVGSLMNNWEITYKLGAVLGGSEKYIRLFLFPLYPTFRFYIQVLLDTPEFFVMFWNSVKITGAILAGQLLVGVPAAWGFARYDFPWKRFLFLLYMVLMMMPFQVTMLSNYLILDKMHLLDTQYSIIFPGIFSTFPVFLMYRFFEGIPNEILESARIDGANELQIFFHFGMPLGASGIISSTVLGFLEYWNLIEQPLTFLKTKSLWPLSLYLPDIGLLDAGKSLAVSVLTLVPSFFVFLAGQNYLEEGISSLKQ